MKIAYILFTNGLEYDDRIRKEMLSLRELIRNVEFKVFAFHGDNHAESGVLSYGVPYEIVSLKHRGGKKNIISMLRKEWDFYIQVCKKVKDYDLLWVCDDQPFFFPLFSNKPIIWDLHEIPGSIIGSRIKNLLFHRMERRCKCLIHANQERVDYLLKNGVIARPEKNYVIRNYPDQNWIAEGEKDFVSFQKFKKWIGDDDYIYLQGINAAARYPWETLSSVIETKRIKAVVMGNVSDEMKKRVLQKYPDANQYIYYAGQVVQSETAPFIAHCKFSMVFYTIETANNRYCEPNRMFQCLGLGKPVIVGCNEPMRNIVGKSGNGIALETDGNVIKDNVKAIGQMLDHFDEYEKKAEALKENYLCESQIETFGLLLNK